MVKTTTILLMIAGCVLSLRSNAQDLASSEKELAFYADVMVNAGKAEHRQRAHAQFHTGFSKLLNIPEARTYQFDQLEWLSSVISADSTFRIMSWQVMLSEDQYKYYAFVIPVDPTQAVVELHDKRSLRSEFGWHDKDSWYGALYYGMQTFVTASGDEAHLLLGYNAHDARTNQKVADVLSFTDEGPRLGMPVFMPGDSSVDQEIKERIILEYADAASGRMQFDRERGLLVYDHVITIFTEGPDAGPLKVPDGSFHGYQYKEGKWYFVDKLFDVMVDTPPGSGIQRDKNRDIFGRPKN